MLENKTTQKVSGIRKKRFFAYKIHLAGNRKLSGSNQPLPCKSCPNSPAPISIIVFQNLYFDVIVRTLNSDFEI